MGDRATGKLIDKKVIDFATKTVFNAQYLDPAKPQCSKTAISQGLMQNTCTNATLPPGLTIAWLGSGTLAASLKFNAWQFKYLNYEQILTLSDDGQCLPLVEKTVMHAAGGNKASIVLFNDI